MIIKFEKKKKEVGQAIDVETDCERRKVSISCEVFLHLAFKKTKQQRKEEKYRSIMGRRSVKAR